MYDAETSMMDAYEERMNAGGPLATMADAHREWHLNAGVPMGTPGCPQDACHIEEPYEDLPLVTCGHCRERLPIWLVRAHFGVA
jgi:hypothetical protein